MPLQNRVSPTGTIEIAKARGTLMGNRGVLHSSKKEIKRQFKSKAWITCLLEFKGRQRELMSPGAYTELFFLDEVTAFAAGHRPCAECRRSRYNEFRDAWSVANNWPEPLRVRAPQLDEVLHGERLAEGEKLTWRHTLAELPHGTMFQIGKEVYAVCDKDIVRWSFDGYTPASGDRFPEEVDVLTPYSVVKTFESEFRPQFHKSALTERD